jgi:hypothetical protein
MAHHHERARAHILPDQGPRGRPAPAGSTARIDCDTCPVAGRGCAGCMVALLGPVRLRLDAVERTAVEVLVERGLVGVEEAAAAYAVPELPDWMVAARDHVEEESRLRAIG